MGKIRTKTVKRASRQVVEKYYSKLNFDFYQNKRVIMDVTIAESKKLKNKIAGYTTHIMKRLARGPVRGISLKLQEEERERRMDHAPRRPTVDKRTMQMLQRLEIGVPRRVKRADAAVAKVKAAPRRRQQKSSK
ncbi:Ribosomal S17 family protein [Leishmania donovani]|uniref:Ribosomal S17 family protein n=1 Tax=Leishmania donovani TaxID=5661 RepID=A0A504Y5I8_LEIDO|nr:Ribosomal S17 family protein [Leishmania donovani]